MQGQEPPYPKREMGAVVDVATTLLQFLAGLPPVLVILLISTLPIVELRGAIPVALLAYGIPWWEAAAFAVVGNLLPIPFILLFLPPVEAFLRRFPVWDRFFTRLIDRTIRKTDEKIKRYESLGLTLFVALPLPVTGAWTGALAAHVFQLGFWRSLGAITLGVLVAASVVTAIVVTGEAAWLML